MQNCAQPDNEVERLCALKELMILDTPPESLFDDISRLANLICNTPIAFISLIDEERQWFKSNIGLAGVAETPRDIAFCAHTILDNSVLEVSNALNDKRFSDNPMVTGYPNIRFYAGAPVVLPDNKIVGTLSVIDTSSKNLDESQIALLKELANYVSQLLRNRQSNIQDKHQESNILSSIVKSSDDAIVGKNLNSIVTSWNVGAEKVFGYTAAEMIGQPITKLFPEDKIEEEAVLMKAIKNGNSIVHYETMRLKKTGELIHVSVSLSPINDISGKIIGASKIARDITNRKNNEKRISQLSKMYQALTEINQAIVRMENESELFPLVSRCAVEFGGMDLAFIVQANEDKSEFTKVAYYGEHAKYVREVLVSPNPNMPQGKGPIGIAYRDNHPVIVQNFFSDPLTAHWRALAKTSNWKSMASFPINKDNKPFAVLSVYSNQLNIFDEEITNLLNEIANDTSFALDNFSRETKRIAAEESLILAASVFQSSSEGIIITNPDNIIIAVNPAFTLITGYSADEVIGRTPSFLESNHHDEDFYANIWNTINEAGHWQGEVWDRRKNGDKYSQLQTINNVLNADGSVKTRVFMFTDNSQQREAEYKIWRQANFDFLTELPNRQMFYERLDHAIKKSQNTIQAFALLLIDIDHFKEVNDTLGHDKGDTLIKEMARRLKSCVNEFDTVARLGGDEFTIIFGNLTDVSAVDALASHILKSLSEPYQIDDELIHSSISIGVTLYPNHANNGESLLKNADQAMYAAKKNGRNCFCYFTPALEALTQNRTQIAKDLRRALAHHQFWVAYQPIIELTSGIVHKAEALIRWQHPVRGLISPADFISIAEDTGSINEIGEWVI